MSYIICEQQRHRSAFAVRCLDSIISPDSIAEISRTKLASEAAHAGLCLAGSETPEDMFYRVVAQINKNQWFRHSEIQNDMAGV